jgi:gliding motility-associated-like protein
MRRPYYFILLLLAFSAGIYRANATHYYGADLFYSHISGTTYAITAVVYGDCAGALFPSLSTGNPTVRIIKGNTDITAITLVRQSPVGGTEVTPVCPAQLSQTKCVNPAGTLPGVSKFIYTGNVTLGDTSSYWKFLFVGSGRSSTITNLSVSSSGSSVVLEASLNNAIVATNASPVYTVIPTPFFCVNKSANYNPGTVDADGDSLVYELVPGLTSGSQVVSYVTGLSATMPMSVAAGSFSFSSVTGQLAFTPNQQQRSLVVYKVSEYRGGKLVGTSMREMTFVVPGNCSNNAPIGQITNGPNTGSSIMSICEGADTLTFNINPTDADGDQINMTVSGLPAGASLQIANNNTIAPTSAFSWDITGVAPGLYTFFVTYQDNGCPMNSKQTQAYSINVLTTPKLGFNLISQATCLKKAVFDIPVAGPGNKSIQIHDGVMMVRNIITSGNMVRDSLKGGVYTMTVINQLGCMYDTTITIADPVVTLLQTSVAEPSCNVFANGRINVQASNATPPYEYAINNGSYGPTGNFTGLQAGMYFIEVRDALGCVKDTLLEVKDSVSVSATAALSGLLCHGLSDGEIIMTPSGGFGGPYTYSMNAGAPQSGNVFTGLAANAYQMRVTDSRSCYFDTTINMTAPAALSGMYTAPALACYGDVNGSIAQTITGGIAPYTYNINGGAYNAAMVFTNLAAGSYTMGVKDANGCMLSNTVVITQPAKLAVGSLNITKISCHDSRDGAIDITGAGGTMPYAYSASLAGGQVPLTGLGGGVYQVRITDANSCKKDTTVELIAPDQLVAEISTIKSLCKPVNTGLVIVKASGGTAPYQYALDGGNYTGVNAFQRVAAGNYTVHVKDDLGCETQQDVWVEDSMVVRIGINVQPVSCYGRADGEIEVLPSGGTEPYSFAFNNGNLVTKSGINGCATGLYRIKVIDRYGCMAVDSVTVPQPDTLSKKVLVTDNNCYRTDISGKIELQVAGGTAPYTYHWYHDAGLKKAIATNLPNGNYLVQITDANGCADSLGVVLSYHDCCTPFIPSAFSPNNDGRNDKFHVVLKGEMDLHELRVYNRFGQCVFYSNNVQEGWDGTLKGQQADVGTYFYYVKGTCGAGAERKIELKGDVVLIR